MALVRSGDSLKNKFFNMTTVPELNEIMEQFVRQVKDGTFKENGWPEWGYGVAKIGVTVLTPLQQAQIDKDESRKDIAINSCCPGVVKTDMSGQRGVSPDQGAETPLYLALLPPGTSSPRGEFLAEKKVIDWRKPETATFPKI